MSSHSQSKSQASFTLIELLITLAVIAILMTVVVISINPSEMMKRNRDVRRLADLNSLNKAIQLFQISLPYASLGDSNTVYVSIPDTSSSCANLGLPPLPSGWSYKCSSPQNYRKIDGTGWIPLNFTSMDIGSPLAALPIDPVNSTSSGNYYTYVTGGSWALTALLESRKEIENTARKDGGYDPERYEIGSNLTLWRNASGLVGYWKFDEGSGTTAYDSSGNNNHGTLYNGPTWTQGKVGGALSFDGVDDYVNCGNSTSLQPTSITFGGWLYLYGWLDKITSYGSHHIFMAEGYAIATNSSAWSVWVNDSTGRRSRSISHNNKLNEWHFVMVTYDEVSGYMKFYWNGVLRDTFYISAGQPIVYTGSKLLRIGNGSSFDTDGLIDEVRIYNRVLSEAEIRAIYNATK